MTNRSQLRLSMLVPAVAAAITGCGGDNQPFVPPKPGNALIYTYPVEGMVDVPTASKALMVFSSKVSETAVMANCAGTAEAPVGGFCVTGPDGPVETASHTNIANDGHTIEFSMKALKPGTTYQVWLHREVSPSAENLDNSKPVFSFTTRQGNPIKSQPPAVIAFNQDKPEAFLDDTDVAAQFPIVDISPVRLTFSEPLFDDSVILGDSVQFIKISEDNIIDFEDSPKFPLVKSREPIMKISKNNIKTETDRHPVLNGMLYDKDLKRRNALRAIEMIKEGATVKEAIKACHTSHSSICEFGYKRTHRQDGRTIKKVQECTDLLNSGVKLKDALKRLNLGAWSFNRYRHFFL